MGQCIYLVPTPPSSVGTLPTHRNYWLCYQLPHRLKNYSATICIVDLYSGAMHRFSTDAPVISGHVTSTLSLLVALPATPPVKNYSTTLCIVDLYSGAVYIFSTSVPVTSGHIADALSLLVALPVSSLSKSDFSSSSFKKWFFEQQTPRSVLRTQYTILCLMMYRHT